jgi:hypothetical protein
VNIAKLPELLMAEAADIIASRPGFARWRFRR